MNNDYNKTISGSSGVNFDGITIGSGITPYNNTIDTNTTRTSSNNQSGNTSTLDLECFITDNLDETVTEKTVDKGTGNIGTIGDLSKLDLSNFSSYTLIYNQSISTCENKIKELEKELDALISVAKDWYSLYPSLDIDKNNLSELIDYYLKSNNSDYESYEYYILEIQKLNEDIDILNTNLDNLVSYYANQKGITIEAATKELMGQTIPSLQNMTITQREEYLNELLYEQRQIYENYQAEYNSKYRNGVVFLSNEERKSFINVAIYLQSLNIFDRVGIEPHHIYELTGQVDGLQSERLIKLIDYCTNIHLTNDDLKLIALEWGEDYAAEFLENRDLNIFDCISEYLYCCENGYEEWAWDFSGLAAYTSTNSYAYVSENEFKHSIGENKITYEEFQADLAIVFNEDGIISRAQEKEQMEQDLLQMQITIYNLEQAAKLLPYETVADNPDFEIAEDYSSYTHIADKSLIKDQFLTNREIAIYDYLYQRNPSDAYAYLEALQDTINRRKGMQQAVEFIKNLDGNALDYLIASWEGFKDGNINFVDGCIDYFTADGVVSDFEYAMMYKTMILSAEDNEYTKNLSAEHKYFLSQCYSVMQSTGNMTIPVLLSVVNPKLGSGAMSLSSAGNATEQAIQNGTPTYKAYLYGTALGVSEAFTEKYAGGIPGLSDVDDLIVYNMVKEGAQEAGQTWIDAGFKRFILGEEIDVNSTTVESMTAAYQGFWVSGIFQGPNIYRNIKTTVQSKLMETGATLGHLKIAETPSVDMANNNVSNIESTSTSNSSNIDGTIEMLYSTDESNAQANNALTNNDSEGLLNALANMSLDNRIEYLKSLDPTMQEVYNNLNGGKNIGNLQNKDKAAIITPYEQNIRYYELLSEGRTESEATTIMLDEFATKYQNPKWAPKEFIIDRMRQSYNKLNPKDKANLSYEEYLKIKLQIIPFDPATQIPETYKEFINIMNSTESCTGYYSPNDLRRLLGIKLYDDGVNYNNGLGRAANKAQNLDSAYFAIPTSEVTYPSNWDSMSLNEQTNWLADRIGLDEGPYKNGYIEIIIDNSLYGDDWTYSTPTTQGSNMMYTPGMHTSGASYEVIIPRIEGIIEHIDPSVEVKLSNATDNMEIFDIFQDALNSGKIKIKDGITFIFHD